MNIRSQKDAESFRSRVSSVDEDGSRRWVYAVQPSGRFYKIRNYLAYFYLAIFFIMPLIHINGNQFLQFNLLEGRFTIFGKIFWPNDFFIFAIAFITGIILVVLFTVVYGRLFCGWACPQTIFMEFVFRKIEWMIEGTPAQQRKLNNAPWNKEKIIKKSAKQILFFGVSFLIANAFLSYIIGSYELFKIIREPIFDHIGLLLGLLVFTTMFYIVFAYVRDIVCTTICPYGRLQGVMYDKDTMQISYDYVRGEPRGKLKNKEAENLGDCIDCRKCVVVCPTGIDIRNGVQMECVGCTACIDACDDVMDQIDLPRGLIRYASENEIQSGQKSKVTTKVKAYSVLLSLLMIFLIVLVATRSNLDCYINRVKGQTFQVAEDGTVSNLFDAKIINKSNREIPIEFKLIDVKGDIRIIGHADGIVLKKEQMNKITFFIDRPGNTLHGRNSKLKIGIYDKDGELLETVKANFLGPFK
ncbi:MAG: cytochrome c oxidase accessory protein CcoG [Chitinophagales bacterium]|nr:cytochrome c oxidase accessory protein CcoG [Chitinophagales bacterium]